MIDYEEILRKQEKIKTRIRQQVYNLENSNPYIDITDILENIQEGEKKEIMSYIFTKNRNRVIMEKKGDYSDKNFWDKEILITREDEYFEDQHFYYLSKLPPHFEVKINFDNNYYYDLCGEYRLGDDIEKYPYWLNKTDIIENSYIYRKSTEEYDNNEDFINKYIIFKKISHKNYLSYLDKDQILFNYSIHYEDGELIDEDIFGKEGCFYIDIFQNPSYNYQNQIKNILNKDKIEIKFNQILNSSCNIIDKKDHNIILKPCYFIGMPLHEEILDDSSYQKFFISLAKKEEQMYKLNQHHGQRIDNILYTIKEESDLLQIANAQLRLY